MFNFNEADDDENLRKLEEQRKEKSAALHTTGIIMALCAGALYGIQSIIGKSLTRPLQLNYIVILSEVRLSLKQQPKMTLVFHQIHYTWKWGSFM